MSCLMRRLVIGIWLYSTFVASFMPIAHGQQSDWIVARSPEFDFLHPDLSP